MGLVQQNAVSTPPPRQRHGTHCTRGWVGSQDGWVCNREILAAMKVKILNQTIESSFSNYTAFPAEELQIITVFTILSLFLMLIK